MKKTIKEAVKKASDWNFYRTLDYPRERDQMV